jgi:hypothetical protein
MIVESTIPLAPADSQDIGHTREWWDSESSRVGMDWPAVIDAAHDLLAVAFGTNSMDDTFERACRDADRKAASRPEDPRILRARRLLADDVSYERAYAEFMRERPTPEATVDSLIFSLRRGVASLAKPGSETCRDCAFPPGLAAPDVQRRLSALDRDQLKDVCRRVQAFESGIAEPWSTDAVAILISAWRKP